MDYVEIHLPAGYPPIEMVAFAISGAHGHISETPCGEPVDPDGTSLHLNRYYYQPSEGYVFVDCDGLDEGSMTSSNCTTRRANLRDDALQRDVVCVATEAEADYCDAAHLIPRCKGEKYIRRVLRNRSRGYGLSDSPVWNIDDHVNGVLLRKDLHSKLHHGKIAFIKTPNFVLQPTDIQRVERGPERKEYITLQQLRPARFDKAEIERTLHGAPPETLRADLVFTLGLNVDALFPGATLNPSSPSIQDSRTPTIQSSRSPTFEGSQSPAIEHPGLSDLGIDGLLSGDVPGDIPTPSTEPSVLQLEAPPTIILDFMYGVAAYRQWGSKDMRDIMEKYRKEHYDSSLRIPKPDDSSSNSSDDDCPPARQRARRPGLRSSTRREETTLGEVMVEMNLALMFLSGISPQEAAKRQEKEREEEERAEQEAGRSKVSEWLHILLVYSFKSIRSAQSMKGPITCHVLDVSIGKPAEGVQVTLQRYHEVGDFGAFDPVSQHATDGDGRCTALLPPRDSEGARQAPQFQIAAGIYKVVFKPHEYFEKTGRKCFYPWIEIPFRVENPDEHYHVPLLISPYSYTTYRGS